MCIYIYEKSKFNSLVWGLLMLAPIIAKHLSVRLIILPSMFSVDVVWSQVLSCFRKQLKVWLVHKHLSHLRMQLKDLVCKSYVHLCKFIIRSSIAALTISLLWRGRRRGRRLAWKREQDREPNCSHWPVKFSASLMSTRERDSSQRSKESKWLSWEMTIPVDPPGYRLGVQNLAQFLNLSTYALPSFSQLVAHGQPSIKQLHVLVQSLRCARHTLRIRTPSCWTP